VSILTVDVVKNMDIQDAKDVERGSGIAGK